MARSISTHVLDVEQGRPAAGLLVTLLRDEEVVAEARTDADGRIASLGSGDLEPGRYRLIFDTGSYFAEQPHLFVTVALEIEVEADGHQHVPLLIAPYAYTGYRGS
jgi:5-hydroxyisourate hydrolase